MVLTVMAENDLGGQEPSAILTGVAIRLLSLRPDPVTIAFISLLCVTPLLLLMSLSPGLLSLASPTETLLPWLTGQALGQPDIAVKAINEGSIVQAGLTTLSTEFVSTPGQAVQLTGLFYSAVLVVLLMSASATRLPVLPALLVTSLGALAIPVARVYGLTDLAGFSLGLMAWLAMIAAQAGRFSTPRPIQAEGLGAGIALSVLFFSTLPLFFAGVVSVGLAIVLRGKQGRVLASIAGVLFAVILLGAELASMLLLPADAFAPFGLALSRLGQTSLATTAPSLGLPHVIALLASGLALAFIQQGPRTFIGRIVGLGTGLFASFAAGLDPLIFIMIMSLNIVFGAPRSDETVSGPAMPLSTLACLACFALVGMAPGLKLGTAYLAHQYAAAENADELGLIFVDSGATGQRLAKGQLPVGPFRNGDTLTPADQSAILLAGLDLAKRLANEGESIFIIAGDERLPLLGDRSAATSEGAHLILSPLVALDVDTETTRKSLQGYLYTNYKRVNRKGTVSPVWEVWEQQN